MDIVRTQGFDRDLKRIGALEEDVEALFEDLRRDPEVGDVIKGLAGARKARFAIVSRRIGKRGGGRVIYILFRRQDAIVLLMAYAKSDKTDLSPSDRKALAAIIEQLEAQTDD